MGSKWCVATCKTNTGVESCIISIKKLCDESRPTRAGKIVTHWTGRGGKARGGYHWCVFVRKKKKIIIRFNSTS